MTYQFKGSDKFLLLQKLINENVIKLCRPEDIFKSNMNANYIDFNYKHNDIDFSVDAECLWALWFGQVVDEESFILCLNKKKGRRLGGERMEIHWFEVSAHEFLSLDFIPKKLKTAILFNIDYFK